MTAGRGADAVFEAAGQRRRRSAPAVEAVRPGGQVVWLGKIDVHDDVAFRWGALMREKRITPLELRRRPAGARFPVAGAGLSRRQAASSTS